MALYYDNDASNTPPLDELIPVERVYAIQFSESVDSHWLRIKEIFRILPEWTGTIDELPFWFGNEESPPFLWASVEPSGLLVHGLVSQDAWQQWHAAFLEYLPEFPTFEV